MSAVGAVVGGASSLVGSLIGADSSRSASNKAADAAEYSDAQTARYTKFSRLLGDRAFRRLNKDIFGNGKGEGKAAFNQTYGTDWANKLQAIADDPSSSLSGIKAPTLQNNVSVNLAKDPIYKQQVQQGMQQLNRRYGAMGTANSSDADNAVSNNMLNYYTNAYGRAEDNLNRTNQNALTSYGLNYTKANDIYNRNVGNTMSQAGIISGAEGTFYQRMLDAAKMGSVANGTAANSAGNTGNALAQIYMNAGNQQSNAINTGIAGVLGAYNNYNMFNYLNKNGTGQMGANYDPSTLANAQAYGIYY